MRTLPLVLVIWIAIAFIIGPFIGRCLRKWDDKHDWILDEEYKNQNQNSDKG